MKERALAILLAMTVAALAGCASPVPQAPAVRPAPPPLEELPGPGVDLFCRQDLRRIPFPSLGIPPYTRLLDVALAPDRVWLLVDQHHIVEVGRNPDQPTFRTITGKEDATWDALDVDPVDGSLWIVSFLRLELIHLNPDGKSTIVRIPRLEGEGGFRDVLVDEEAVYVVPTCAEHALWKVARDGKLLGQAFRREGKEPLTLRKEFTPEEGQGSLVGCVPVSMARDLSGRVTVFDGLSLAFYRQEAGEWKPLLEIQEDPQLPAGGVRVDNPGTEQAIWNPFSGAAGNAPAFFILGEEPVFQPELDRERSTRDLMVIKYLRPGTDGMTPLFERCKRVSWGASSQIATDRHGFVSAIDNQLVLGTFGTD